MMPGFVAECGSLIYGRPRGEEVAERETRLLARNSESGDSPDIFETVTILLSSCRSPVGLGPISSIVFEPEDLRMSSSRSRGDSKLATLFLPELTRYRSSDCLTLKLDWLLITLLGLFRLSRKSIRSGGESTL